MDGEQPAGVVLAPAGDGQVGLGPDDRGVGGLHLGRRPAVLLVQGHDVLGLLGELGNDRGSLGPLFIDLGAPCRKGPHPERDENQGERADSLPRWCGHGPPRHG